MLKSGTVHDVQERAAPVRNAAQNCKYEVALQGPGHSSAGAYGPIVVPSGTLSAQLLHCAQVLWPLQPLHALIAHSYCYPAQRQLYYTDYIHVLR